MQTDITIVLEKCPDTDTVIVDSFLINGTEVNVTGYEIGQGSVDDTGDIPLVTLTLAPSSLSTVTGDGFN